MKECNNFQINQSDKELEYSKKKIKEYKELIESYNLKNVSLENENENYLSQNRFL